MKPLRVLHCPALVGGHPHELVLQERKLGLKSWGAALSDNPYGYHIDHLISPAQHGILRHEWERWKLVFRALKSFDILHFNFGRSILPTWVPEETHPEYAPFLRKLYQIYSGFLELRDLAWFKKAGKGIVVTYQGNDARQGDFCLNHFETSPAAEAPEYYTEKWDARRRKRIAQFARYADRIYAFNPDLLHVLPPHARFLPYCHLNLEVWEPPTYETPSVPHLVHAPTRRNIKGTRFILEAVERLKQEGLRFDFTLVEGVPRNEARRIYENADLFIDQLLVGWYGGAAVELMALGKPVVCYIRNEDLKFIPSEMRQDLPILQASPSNVAQVLKECLAVNKGRLSETGKKSRAYAEKWHNPAKIASQIKEDYEDIFKKRRVPGIRRKRL